jgi:hypothetical protein
MKASIKVFKAALLERVEAVAAADAVANEERTRIALEAAHESRQKRISASLEEAEKWRGMSDEAYVKGHNDYHIHWPTENAEHQAVIRALKMSSEEVITLSLQSDLAKYLAD